MNKENKAFEYEALVAEGQAIGIEVKGMIWENEQRKVYGESMAYTESSFNDKAAEMKEVVKKLRKLKS